MAFKTEIGCLKLIENPDTTIVPDTLQIIESLLPEHNQVILGGSTGANKSYIAMDMGMSLAANEDKVMGFKINKHYLRVLYVDTECGQNEMIRRYQRISKTLNWNEDAISRFKMVSIKGGNRNNICGNIKGFVEDIMPDVLIIDCLYNINERGKDMTKNVYLQPLLDTITDLRLEYHLTCLVVAHYNKGGHEIGLNLDRLAGGSALINWLQHCFLVTKTNDVRYRILKLDKSREIASTENHHLLEFEFPIMKNHGVLLNDEWKPYLMTEQKTLIWKECLEKMSDEFTTNQFTKVAKEVKNVCAKTTRNWLKHMLRHHVIERLNHGIYKKKFKVIGGNDDEE